MRTHAVTDKLPHDRIPTRLNITLNSVTYITDSAARTRRVYSLVKAFARCVHQPLRFRRYIPAGESGGVIAVIPVELGAEVDTYYIAGAQLALFGRYAVNYLVVYRYTGSSGVALVIFKVGLAAAASDVFLRQTVDLSRCYSGLYRFAGYL